MTSEAINFTKQSLSELPVPPKGKRVYYRDTKQPGLILDIRPSGSKSFYLYKRIKKRPVRLLIGPYPDISIENARRLTRIKIGEIAEGKNPQEEIRRIKSEMTFGEFFEQYMKRYSMLHKKSWMYDQREVTRFLSQWFKRQMSDIPKTDVQQIHEKIFRENGLYQANRILERIRSIYNKAIEWGWRGSNPAMGIKKYKEKSRDRFVQPSEMPWLMHSIEIEENETAKDFFWVLLLTGARKTNTLMMQYEQLNWERCEWRIPDTKNGDPLNIALVPQAIEILRRRRLKTNSRWIFPQEDDNEKHFINPKRAWKRTLARATLMLWEQDEFAHEWVKNFIQKNYYFSEEVLVKKCIQQAEKDHVQLPPSMMDIRIHDIRRTFGSYQALAGASLQVIGKSLGHKSQQSTQVYARLNLDPVRSLIEKAVDVMFAQTVNKN
jgi:integrase